MEGKSYILETLQKIFRELEDTLKRKNADYTGGKSEFFNFEKSADVANVSVGKSIIVRMMDKMTRMSSLLEREAQVKDEKIEDTIKDLIGYAIILLAYLNYQTEPEYVWTTPPLWENIKGVTSNTYINPEAYTSTDKHEYLGEE